MVKRNVNRSLDLMVDPSRPFAVPVARSNLQQFRPASVPLTLQELINIRSSMQPAREGIYTTRNRRITRNSLGTLQTNVPQMVGQQGKGVVGDAVKYGRRKLGDLIDYGGDKAVDYAANYGKQKIRGVSGRVRGDGFLRDLAGSAVSGLGSFIGNKIKGNGRRKRATKPKAKRAPRAKFVAAQEGDGFFRDLAGSAVSGLGSFIGNKIKGKGGKAKPKGRKRKGSGIFAPGMAY